MQGFGVPSERFLRLFFIALGLLHLGIGVWMFAAPHSFFLTVGAFDRFNRHYERDTATFYFAFALGSWIAASRPGWRVPVLSLTTLQYTVHTVNHAIDVNDANNAWAGPFDLVSLAAGTLQFATLLLLLGRRTAARTRL